MCVPSMIKPSVWENWRGAVRGRNVLSLVTSDKDNIEVQIDLLAVPRNVGGRKGRARPRLEIPPCVNPYVRLIKTSRDNEKI